MAVFGACMGALLGTVLAIWFGWSLPVGALCGAPVGLVVGCLLGLDGVGYLLRLFTGHG